MKNVGNTYALRHFSKIKKAFIILHSKKIIAGKGSGKDVEFEEEKKELSSKGFFPASNTAPYWEHSFLLKEKQLWKKNFLRFRISPVSVNVH